MVLFRYGPVAYLCSTTAWLYASAVVNLCICHAFQAGCKACKPTAADC